MYLSYRLNRAVIITVQEENGTTEMIDLTQGGGRWAVQDQLSQGVVIPSQDMSVSPDSS